MSECKFSLTRRTEKVVITDSSGVDQEFTVVEMSGTERDRWLNRMGSRMKMDAKGNAAGLKDFSGLQSGLVALCLRDPAGQPIPDPIIDGWPASVVSGLFQLCQKINGMGDEEEVKND